MVSFQPKIGWKRQKKRENKNYRFISFRSYPTENRKFQKNSKNIQKYSKIPLRLHFKPKKVGKCWKREKIKTIVSFRSYPTGNRKLIKNNKIFKKFKNTITTSFQEKTAWKRLKKRENKNYRFVSFLHNA